MRPQAKVRFRTNLGSRDADALGLDFTKCQVGSEIETSVQVAERLEQRGIAEITERLPQEPEAVPEEKQVKAVPPKPEVAEAKPPRSTKSGGSPQKGKAGSK